MRRRALAMMLAGASVSGCGLGLEGSGASPRADGGTLLDAPQLVDVVEEDAGGGADADAADTATDTRYDGPTIREGGADAGHDAARDSMADAPPPEMNVACGTNVCVPPSGCCLTTNSCDTMSNCFNWAGCDDRQDCAGSGGICCAGVHNGNNALDWAACMTPSDCSGVGSGEYGLELCDPADPNPCSTGSCTGMFSNGYSFCQ